MFALPGVLGLIFLTYVRPQSFVDELHGLPLLHICYALAIGGFAVDLRSRLTSPRTSQMLWLGGLYLFFGLVTLGINAPDRIGEFLPLVFIDFAMFFMVAQTLQSLRAVRTAMQALVAISVFLSVVGIHQGTAPKGCIASKTGWAGIPDGRLCETHEDCWEKQEFGFVYRCEKVGLFGTYSINNRVRWIGIIEDPNELAMCVAICVPMLIGLYLLRPRARSAVTAAIGIGMFVLTVYFTGSRGGQVVFGTAFGIYMYRRYGIRALVVGGIIAAPLLLLQPERPDAFQSKMERLDALFTAASLMWERPLTGVGLGRFTDFNSMTAHNSYGLSGAELGLPGLFLFLSILYQALRAFYLISTRYEIGGPGRAAHIIAGSLGAAMCGMAIGIFFLSFTTSPILWVFLGVVAGFQLAVQRHDPDIKLSLRGVDYLRLVGITLALGLWMYAYPRWKVLGSPF